MGKTLTIKQKKFADNYIRTGNGTKSYKDAGYKWANDNVAAVEAGKLLTNPKIKEYIRKKLDSKDKRTIASQDEVLEFFTRGIRGELDEEVIAGYATDEKGKPIKLSVRKEIALKEREKCAEALAKRYGIDKPNDDNDNEVVQIVDDIK